MSSVKLINLCKSFNKIKVLNNMNLDIKEGEIVSLLGPSGCGKSTTLKLIAGILHPDCGDILLNNESVLDIPIGKRDTVIVFQDYLLFPHMTLYENIEFGLKMKKINKNIRKSKVNELINLVKLKGYENKYPNELSGGQQQRVAIARSLAINPKVLLLDEPFSNLDINLRNEMREFVLGLQKHLKITTILVTHDKEEALMMSDRIAVMLNGEVKQFDTPDNLYENPKSKEVANIFGEKNYLIGNIRNGEFVNDIISIKLDKYKNINIDNVELMIPKESIILKTIDNDVGRQGSILKKRYAGDKVYYDVDIDGTVLKASSNNNLYEINEKVDVFMEQRKILFFPVEL
ncbi:MULTISPECIES: ABC transporter ATP-binding protein [unclassified Clostridioides]|uniref:ABC transporter ATP-binding protein n=1 Tax=unclassified Clostridioides TaxID=2635829 RepID=UPI001D0C5A34|nr:ABC transporter ATP-binding protein [Clostridioides sp. ES-S-0001-02]MCC0641225.1 ABC transporter ATP-binding protein [Clostridioides sp. ES-S-0049-03]MCC0654337.1 ABC transporter ATP-binding protein [Clostridioides sp. ES-S-0001-03]MCC0674095.1 ABC transporter ATP-binding protein [Clostridioides sp. ES-S-0145-01]MCC0677096.1 ABC transporter ATP-binding protein [Clostridioides sp. ES-W-0018-02]MCC0681798.1 ABC transporter ATP-binding protein [Clostridioides sp. ES-S-0005-03]MCC0695837.1 AB